MRRKSAYNLPPGIHRDQHGQYWATLEGEEARTWRDRYPGRIAVDDGLIAKNPCKGVKLPRPDDEEIHPLTPEQVHTLLTMLDTTVLDKATGERHPHRNAALYHVALRCGPRQGELLGLRRKDIDLERGELHVRGQMQRGARTSGKTKRAHRTLPYRLTSCRRSAGICGIKMKSVQSTPKAGTRISWCSVARTGHRARPVISIASSMRCCGRLISGHPLSRSPAYLCCTLDRGAGRSVHPFAADGS